MFSQSPGPSRASGDYSALEYGCEQDPGGDRDLIQDGGDVSQLHNEGHAIQLFRNDDGIASTQMQACEPVQGDVMGMLVTKVTYGSIPHIHCGMSKSFGTDDAGFTDERCF